MGELIREVSYNEQLYLDLQDLSNTYAIQFCFSVKKLTNLAGVEEAVNTVLQKSPGINVYYKNRRYFKAEEPVRIKKVSVSSDDIFDDDVFRLPIDYRKKSIEVLYVTGKEKEYLVFQIHHAVLDGMASLVFVQNVMNVLAGREIIPCESDMTDIKFVKEHPSCRIPESKLPNIKIKGSAPVSDYKIKFKVVEVPGYPTPVVAKLSHVLAGFCEKLPTRIMIPTDVRKHEPGKKYNTNLTLPLFLCVKENDTVQDVYADMLMKLRQKRDLNVANTKYYHYRELPEWMRKSALKFLLNRARKTNRFSVGGLISFLGKVDLADFANPVIEFNDFYSFPIHEPLCPISITVVQYFNKTAVCITYYEGQFSDEWIHSLEAAIREEMKPGIYDNFVKNRTNPEDVSSMLLRSLRDNKEETAVIDESGVHSCKELSSLVYDIIRRLEESKEEGPVGIYADRGISYAASAFACILSSVSFIPIDKSKTEKEIRDIINESKLKTVLSDEENSPACMAELRKIVIKDKAKSDALPEDYVIPNAENPSREVYRIYTSGTTGKPKGVPISAENISNYLCWALKKFQSKGSINMPLFTSLSVDLTMTSLFLPILSGGRIHAFPGNFKPGIMDEILSDPELNTIKCTPTHLQFVKDAANSLEKTLIIGGENLPVSLCRKLSERFENLRIFNEYGPTETTVAVTCFEYDNAADYARGEGITNVPIGTPVDNTGIILIKDDTLVLKEHEIGEICITGKSVFAGYSSSEEEPFVTVQQRKYYKTGDLGYIANGILHCVGRIGSQVKINGNRVEPDYIASTIRDLDGVENAAVCFEGQLVAFVVSDITEEAIKKSLSEMLPGYMVPKKIITVSEIPLSGSGKTDFGKLKEEYLSTKDFAGSTESEGDFSDIKNPVNEAFHILENEEGVYFNASVSSLGMESVDILLFMQKICEKYPMKEKENDFYQEVLQGIDEITFADLKKLIDKYSGRG